MILIPIIMLASLVIGEFLLIETKNKSSTKEDFNVSEDVSENHRYVCAFVHMACQKSNQFQRTSTSRKYEQVDWLEWLEMQKTQNQMGSIDPKEKEKIQKEL